MTKEPLKIGAILDSVSTRKDRSFKIVFESQEIGSEQASNMFGMMDSCGWLIFAPYERSEVVIPNDPPPEFKAQKSYSQRLREVLYVLWKQKGKVGDSESFYREHMERFIQNIKDRLEPEA